MKNIKILFIICFISYSSSWSQTHSESIADVTVAGQKTTIAGLLGVELYLRKEQLKMMKELKKEEESYSKKRQPLSNASSTLVYGATLTIIETLNKKIPKIKTNIRIRKFATFGIRHGLKQHEADLEKEERYLEKLKEERNVLYSGLALSGGSGHNYTAFLKLLKRLMRVRGEVHRIDKEVRALMGASWLLAK